MDVFNIYMAGVGGQGIGLLSEVLLRAADYAGYTVKAVDTHGLAQRGGIVVSQLRIGTTVYTPLISANAADLVIALERHEALRALHAALKDGGTLIYYDTVWQPLDVRLKDAQQVSVSQLEAEGRRRQVTVVKVQKPDLAESRMQNMVVLAHIDRLALIRGITGEHYRQAMQDLMAGTMLTENLALFNNERRGDG